MIINGKLVEEDSRKYYKHSQQIQQRIDQINELPETTKVELPKKELRELDTRLNNFGYDSFNSQFGDAFGTQSTTLNNKLSPENRAAYYDMYEEMAACPFLARGLQTIADDGTQKNVEGDTVKVYSNDEDIKDILDELFHIRLNLNKELWSIFFETCKIGDNFYEIIPDSYEHPTQVARIRYLNPERVNRVEKNGKLAFYTYKTDYSDDKDFSNALEVDKKNQEVFYKLQPWQIVHFKIANKKFAPYGGSLLDAGVRTYRRYSMLEDAMMIYRLARVPERRIFKIDCGNLSTTEANRYINKIKNNYRNSQIMDDKGNINRNAAAMSLTQDIFVGTREGQQGTEITTLAPGTALNNIDDIRFFRDELLWTLNIPPEYLGFTSDSGSSMAGKGSLAMQDVKFARFIERIQYYIEEGLTKIAAVELFFKKKKKADLQNFRIELTPPSNVKEIMDIEYLNQKISLISAMLGTNLFPKDFILKYVMKMTKKEIADINLQKDIEMASLAAQAGGMAGGGMPMGGDMGGMPMGGDMGGMPMGGDMGAAPAPMMSVKTEELTPATMVKVFGKDVLLENKEDYSKLMKAYEEYKKEKEANLIKEEVEESLSNNEFLDKVRNLIIKEELEPYNDSGLALFYENELGGLKFGDNKFSIYKKEEKKGIITEEREI